MRGLCGALEVDDAQRRVHRRLNEDDVNVLSDRAFQRGGVGGVAADDFDAPFLQFVEKRVRAAVDARIGDDARTGLE